VIQVIIKRAEHIGFCSGVDRAIALSEDVLKKTQPLYVTGDLVHNAVVMDDLSKKGLKAIDLPDLPENSTVMIQAHGASPELMQELRIRGNELVDGTCPIVKKSFDICQKCSQSSYQLIVLGQSKHPEMMALKGIVKDAFILTDLDDLKRNINENHRLNQTNIALCAQTTKPLKEFSEFSAYLTTQLKQFQHLIVYNTICDATIHREVEIKSLASHNDCVIVVGGVKSSNTRKLYDIAKARNINSHLVHSLSDLEEIKRNIFQSETCVIASGTSTPMTQVEAVENYITSEM
jgi:4-hydroxy-3-methylbut-2-enyl diphosphate reductase